MKRYSYCCSFSFFELTNQITTTAIRCCLRRKNQDHNQEEEDSLSWFRTTTSVNLWTDIYQSIGPIEGSKLLATLVYSYIRNRYTEIRIIFPLVVVVPPWPQLVLSPSLYHCLSTIRRTIIQSLADTKNRKDLLN